MFQVTTSIPVQFPAQVAQMVVPVQKVGHKLFQKKCFCCPKCWSKMCSNYVRKYTAEMQLLKRFLANILMLGVKWKVI